MHKTILLSEFAYFSHDAYQDNLNVELANWKILTASTDKDSYFGKAYVKKIQLAGSDKQYIQCVIAHRGTLLELRHPIDAIEDLCNDLLIATQHCPSEFTEAAIPFCRSVLAN